MKIQQIPTSLKIIIGIVAIPAISSLLAYLNVTYWPTFQF